MNSQHKFMNIIHNLKCLILVMDTWVIKTLYTISYLPSIFTSNLMNFIQILKYSTYSIIKNNVGIITNIKSKKYRENLIFRIENENKFLHKYTNHHIILEWVWTLIPLLIMVVILFVSLLLLYSAYGSGGIWITTYIIKIIGSQWFWTYEVLNNLTNIHYVDFYTQSLQHNTCILFSLLSHSLPHLAYTVDTNKDIKTFMTNTLSDADFVLDTSAKQYLTFDDEDISDYLFKSEQEIKLENELITKFRIFESCVETKNNITNLQTYIITNPKNVSEAYNNFFECLREFSKSEEKLHFYELIRIWQNNNDKDYINALPIPHYKNIIFDSNILKNTYLNKDKPMRLLDVDNRVYLSMKHPIDLYVTTNDVIHSYAIPSFGIKLDSLPGRINYGCTFVLRPGIYYGQCSELCGINHAYMPTSVVILDKYKAFETKKLLEHIHLFQIQCQN